MANWSARAKFDSPGWQHGAVAGWMLGFMVGSWACEPVGGAEIARWVLLAGIVTAWLPLLVELSRQLWKLNFNVDVLAGLSIGSALVFGHYWVAAVVILMLSGGKTLEDYATRRASSILGALARRMPSIAHRMGKDAAPEDVRLDQVAVGDTLVIYPHELCPVDGAVVSGTGQMDESYLTGEPFLISKAPGSTVISGALNGTAALAIQATRVAAESRYAKVVEILRKAERDRPRMRRMADRLAAWYTPLAVAIAIASWAASGDPQRLLAVLVIATPCPLLLAVPIAILGAISVAARRGILVKNPTILENITRCETLIADKTGTLTYGRPELQQAMGIGQWTRRELLQFAGALERYSKHPLAGAVLAAAQADGIDLPTPRDVFEIPGHGITAELGGHIVTITGRNRLTGRVESELPPAMPGLESVVLIDGKLAGLLRFRDESRPESKPFLGHLRSHHGIRNIVLLSGDRVPAVESFAREMGIRETYGSKSPEEKVAIVRTLTAQRPTLYIGDGINDAPAMMSATAGIAMGANSDITAEAAGAVVLHSSLASIDELIHIGSRMRRIALTSAVGGIGLSFLGIVASAFGYITPIEGALLQEGIDLVSILYALRMALPSRSIGDFKAAEFPVKAIRAQADVAARQGLSAGATRVPEPSRTSGERHMPGPAKKETAQVGM